VAIETSFGHHKNLVTIRVQLQKKFNYHIMVLLAHFGSLQAKFSITAFFIVEFSLTSFLITNFLIAYF
jgi:hypothetical protein